jgi:protocatechuate 3,4-dioxygenase beta subunit
VDGNFQGFGRFETGSTGEYRFRTIKPVPYTLRRQFRAPHIHMAVNRNGRRIATTQAHIRGHADNGRDGLLRRLSASERDTVLVDFARRPRSTIGEYTARFDVVVRT